MIILRMKQNELNGKDNYNEILKSYDENRAGAYHLLYNEMIKQQFENTNSIYFGFYVPDNDLNCIEKLDLLYHMRDHTLDDDTIFCVIDDNAAHLKQYFYDFCDYIYYNLDPDESEYIERMETLLFEIDPADIENVNRELQVCMTQFPKHEIITTVKFADLITANPKNGGIKFDKQSQSFEKLTTDLNEYFKKS